MRFLPPRFPGFFATIVLLFASAGFLATSGVAIAEPRIPGVIYAQARFDLDFPGGTPTDLAEAIRKASGKPCNVIAQGEAAKWRIPPLKVGGVTAEDIFRVLSKSTKDNWVATEKGRYRASYTFECNIQPIDDNSVWLLSYSGEDIPKPTISVQVLNLSEYLDNGYTVDDITTAIGLTLEMQKLTPAEMKFHKETRLLVVAGTAKQCEAAMMVLGGLQGHKAAHLEAPGAKPKETGAVR